MVTKMQESDSDFLTVAEVAELVRLPIKTVRFQLSNNVIPSYKWGSSRQIRVRRSDVLAAFRPA
jgi:excisionase family DNA binding protein